MKKISISSLALLGAMTLTTALNAGPFEIIPSEPTYTVTCTYSDGRSWTRSGRTARQAQNLAHTCSLFRGYARISLDTAQ